MVVKAIHKFWTGGRLVLEGEEVEVDESLAREVINSGKAVEAAPAVPPETPPAPESEAQE